MSENKDVSKDSILTDIDKRIAEQVEKSKILIIDELEAFLHNKMKKAIWQEILKLEWTKENKPIISESIAKHNNEDKELCIIESSVGSGKTFGLKLLLDSLKEEEIDIKKIDEYVVKSKLEKILDERKLSRTWLREKTNISKSTMSYILNNPDTVSLKNAFKIAKVLGVTVEEVFDFKIK